MMMFDGFVGVTAAGGLVRRPHGNKTGVGRPCSECSHQKHKDYY